MTVRRSTPQDFPTLHAWGLKWGADYSIDQFPHHGFIIDDLAAVFLYQTDSSCCWIENLIRNKDAKYIDAQKAVALVIDAAFRDAKELGYKVAYASTNIYEVARRAQTLGASVKPNQLLLTKILAHQE